jgi:hypothetical protein
MKVATSQAFCSSVAGIDSIILYSPGKRARLAAGVLVSFLVPQPSLPVGNNGIIAVLCVLPAGSLFYLLQEAMQWGSNILWHTPVLRRPHKSLSFIHLKKHQGGSEGKTATVFKKEIDAQTREMQGGTKDIGIGPYQRQVQEGCLHPYMVGCNPIASKRR